jgi:hypothetical protein
MALRLSAERLLLVGPDEGPAEVAELPSVRRVLDAQRSDSGAEPVPEEDVWPRPDAVAGEGCEGGDDDDDGEIDAVLIGGPGDEDDVVDEEDFYAEAMESR